jgi:hypothetical protein
VSEDAEGIVSFSYRTQPDDPPDVQTIQKQMAIVAWQPGPNRVVQVPDLVRALTILMSALSFCHWHALQQNRSTWVQLTNLSGMCCCADIAKNNSSAL